MKTVKCSQKRAFTLIELLVVVAIIALLIAILLPSLGKARKLARAAACGANLHSIGQTMAAYASEWDGALLGSTLTTGRAIYDGSLQPAGKDSTGTPYSESNCPNIIQNFDWMAPAGKLMNVGFDEGPSATSRISRFNLLSNSFKGFICPDNDLRALWYVSSPGPSFTGTWVETSYCASYNFLVGSGTTGTQYETYTAGVTLPAYKPNVNLVGSPSAKIFMADGAKFSNTSTLYDINTTYRGSDYANQFNDFGAYAANSHSWDRSYLFVGGQYDARQFAYRHGDGGKGSASGTFKMEALYFDGHVAAINDKDSANPDLWAPTGTLMKQALVTPQPDVIAKYFSAGQHNVP